MESTGIFMKKTFLLSLLPAALIAACAAQTVQPTLSAEDQNFIVTAVAQTIMAENNSVVESDPVSAASATPLPTQPTMIVTVETLTLTPETQVSVDAATQTITATGSDPCDKVLKISDAGPLSNVRFKNKTGGQIRLGIHLWKENAYGQCGYLPNNPISIGKDQSYVVSLPNGSYFAWAWITYKNGETSPIHGNFNNSSSVGGTTIEIIIDKSGISG